MVSASAWKVEHLIFGAIQSPKVEVVRKSLAGSTRCVVAHIERAHEGSLVDALGKR